MIKKYELLEKMFMKWGCEDLALCYSYKYKDAMCFSKWIKYKYLMHLNWYDVIPEVRMTREKFMERASHRTVLDIELLFDIDDREIIRCGKTFAFDSIKAKTKYILKELKELGHNPKVFFTGSKSYHVSLILPKMRDMSMNERRDLKVTLLSYYGADLQKASERCMIALEYAPHYKSGRIKEEVEL